MVHQKSVYLILNKFMATNWSKYETSRETKTITFRLPIDEYYAVIKASADEKTAPSKFVSDLIIEYVSKNAEKKQILAQKKEIPVKDVTATNWEDPKLWKYMKAPGNYRDLKTNEIVSFNNLWEVRRLEAYRLKNDIFTHFEDGYIYEFETISGKFKSRKKK